MHQSVFGFLSSLFSLSLDYSSPSIAYNPKKRDSYKITLEIILVLLHWKFDAMFVYFLF